MRRDGADAGVTPDQGRAQLEPEPGPDAVAQLDGHQRVEPEQLQRIIEADPLAGVAGDRRELVDHVGAEQLGPAADPGLGQRRDEGRVGAVLGLGVELGEDRRVGERQRRLAPTPEVEAHRYRVLDLAGHDERERALDIVAVERHDPIELRGPINLLRREPERPPVAHEARAEAVERRGLCPGPAAEQPVPAAAQRKQGEPGVDGRGVELPGPSEGRGEGRLAGRELALGRPRARLVRAVELGEVQEADDPTLARGDRRGDRLLIVERERRPFNRRASLGQPASSLARQARVGPGDPHDRAALEARPGVGDRGRPRVPDLDDQLAGVGTASHGLEGLAGRGDRHDAARDCLDLPLGPARRAALE
ncbi:hypothetical protein ENSA5_29880 [Enhygromyxa salina]|uniref:Uncharacterized protein n=1 Tax=Enhygromyxa salina TaxID=215803 RepID=A0A2S9Y065_9BACT|nr:hypothetical protein ENSA5_29880 [Enhygromyxa salina]